MNEKETLVVKAIVLGFVGLVFLITLFGSFYIVNAGERGILLTLGRPEPQARTEGIHFKYPIVQSVVYMDVKTQKYETSASSASKDLQIVQTNLAVNYHLSPDSVVNLYKEIGKDYREKVIQPAVQEVVKASTAKFTAEELITKRETVKQMIDDGLKERLNKRGMLMETTSITNFDFSQQFNAAIESKVTAEQNALTEKNRLVQIEYQAKQKIAEAEGTSQSAILQAEAEAKRKLLNAESEAKALEMQKNVVTTNLIELRRIEVQLKMAERWNGQLPMYNLGGNTLPILNVPTQQVAAAVASS